MNDANNDNNNKLARFPTPDDLKDFDLVAKTFNPLIQKLVLVVYSASKSNPSIERDDLQQEALIAVANAIRLYDAKRGVFFSVYLKHAIENRLKAYLRSFLPNYYKKHPEIEGKFVVVPVYVGSLDSHLEENPNFNI